MKIFQWHSLKTRVILFTLSIFVISIWSLSFYVSQMLREDMQRHLGGQQFSTVSILADDINNELNNRFNALRIVAKGVDPVMFADKAALKSLLESQHLFLSLFNGGAFFTGIDGTTIASLPLSANRLGVNYMSRDYLVAPLKKGKTTVSEVVVGKVLRAPIVAMATPVRDTQGNVIGALVGIINLAQPNFLDKISNGHYGEAGGYLIVSQKQRIVVSAGDKSRIMESLAISGSNPVIDRFLQGYEGSDVLVNPQGLELMASAKGVPTAGWSVMALLPTTEAFAPIYAMWQRTLLTTILLTLLVGILTWWMMRRQLSPMLDTVKTLASLSDTNQPLQPLPVSSQDEIGDLVGGFNRLLTTLEQREAQLRSFYEFDLVGLTITSPEKGWIQINKCLCDMLEYSEQELRTMTWAQLTHPDDLAAGVEQFNKMLAGEIDGYSLEKRFISRTGKIIPTHLVARCVRKANGEIDFVLAMVEDISERKAAAKEIENLAFYDTLTNLPNRRLLLDRLKQALVLAARSGKEGALLFIDLDNFKNLNDTLGHDTGDLLLKQVAQRLVSCVRDGDTVARIGGDEFVILLAELSEQPEEAASQTKLVALKILTALNHPYQLDNFEYRNTPSIGASLFSQQDSSEDLMKQADIAMYQAKKSGRNAFRFFDPQMQDIINARANMEGQLRNAIENNEFQLYFQIQVDGAAHPLGAEALIRWIHPESGLVSPAQFIPLAEETGMILPIGKWVLETACAQLKIWQQAVFTRHLTLSVNVSAKQFHEPNFVGQVLEAVRRYDINPKLLKLEPTESILLDNIDETIATMHALKEIGVGFALDDFGTGFSSLQYLKKLPLSQLKIDRSFVRDMVQDSNDQAIVRTIISMAQSLNLEVIAEGVETEDQLQMLKTHGCNHYQGYLFGKPVPIEEFEASLKQG